MVVGEGGLQVTPVCGGAPGEREMKEEGKGRVGAKRGEIGQERGGRGGRDSGRKRRERRKKTRREVAKGGCGRDGGRKGSKR